MHVVVYGNSGAVCANIVRHYMPCDEFAEIINLFPVGKIDHCIALCRPAGHPHDEADHAAVEEAVAGIVDFACKNRQVFGVPGYLPEELLQIGIRLGRALFRLARHDVHRKEGAGSCVKNGFVLSDEVGHLRIVFAIADARTDDDLVERLQIQGAAFVDRKQTDPMLILLDNRLETLAYFSGVPVRR